MSRIAPKSCCVSSIWNKGFHSGILQRLRHPPGMADYAVCVGNIHISGLSGNIDGNSDVIRGALCICKCLNTFLI